MSVTKSFLHQAGHPVDTVKLNLTFVGFAMKYFYLTNLINVLLGSSKVLSITFFARLRRYLANTYIYCCRLSKVSI